jgi:hypothetical protein
LMAWVNEVLLWFVQESSLDNKFNLKQH